MTQLHCVRDTVSAELNSSTPVDGLPDEILALIFEHHDAGARYFGHYDESPIHPTVVVASVCARWRAVALAYPALWSRLDLNTPRAHLGYLSERTRGYPLSLFYDHAIVSSPKQLDVSLQLNAVAKFLEANLGRTRVLEVEGLSDPADDHHKEVVDALFHTQAPSLTELTISSEYDFPLTRPLFGDHAPHLRRVTVSGLDITWSPGLFSNLSSLAIKGGNIAFLPGTDLCDIIRSLPDLESLCLQRLLISESQTQGCTRRMELARLQTLTLNLPASVISHILSSFELPTLRSISLTPRMVHERGHGPTEVPPLCDPGMLPRTLLETITRLHITFTEKIGYFRNVSLHTLLNGHSSDDTLAFSLSCYFADIIGGSDAFRMAWKLAKRLKAHYFAASMPILVLESSFDRTEHPLIVFLERLPGAVNLVLKGLDDASILSATFIRDLAPSDLSALRKLTFQRLELDEEALHALSACFRKLDGRLETLVAEDVRLVASDEVVKNALDDWGSVVARMDVRSFTIVPPSK